MKLAMIGLGKMGGNMTTRLLRSGIEVVGYDRSVEVVTKLVETEGMVSSSSVADAVSKLGENGEKRIVWLMLPAWHRLYGRRHIWRHLGLRKRLLLNGWRNS